MSNASKNKGKTYERSLAENLQKVFNLPFRRVPNSGAATGGVNIIRTNDLDPNQINIFSGDIIPPQELMHVEFEAKFHKDIGKIGSWFDGNSIIDDWIRQVSVTVKPYWFLCWKLNNLGEFILTRRDFPFDMSGNILIYRNIYYIGRLVWNENGFFTINKDKLLLLKPANPSSPAINT